MMMNTTYLIAQEEGTAFFFVKVLTQKILAEIKTICHSLGFIDFVIHGFISVITDNHFVQIEGRD